MTEVKLVGDKVPSIAGLTSEPTAYDLPELDDESKDFLTNPLRKDFMTEFSLGSNKLQFYGQPFAMSKHSQLIKDSLKIFSSSKPPYPLLTAGIVLERPMAMLWLMMNDFSYNFNGLTTLEMLHMYRVANYLILDQELTRVIIGAALQQVSRDNVEELKKLDQNNMNTIQRLVNDPQSGLGIIFLVPLYGLIKQLGLNTQLTGSSILKEFVGVHSDVIEAMRPEDRQLITTLLNEMLAHPETIRWEDFLSINDVIRMKGKQDNKAEIQRRAIRNIFDHTKISRDIKDAINYIPVFGTDNDWDHYTETYAQRNMPKGDLGRLNTEWEYDAANDIFVRGSYADENWIEMEIREWTRDFIIFGIREDYNGDSVLKGRPLLEPIVP